MNTQIVVKLYRNGKQIAEHTVDCPEGYDQAVVGCTDEHDRPARRTAKTLRLEELALDTIKAAQVVRGKAHTYCTLVESLVSQAALSRSEARRLVYSLVAQGSIREQRITENRKVEITLHLPHEVMPPEEQDEWSDA